MYFPSRNYMLKIILIFVLGTSFSGLIGQEPKQVSETENKIQDAFLSARLHATAGHYEKALMVLDSLSKEHRNRSVIYYEQALLYIDKKEYNKAAEKLQRALSLEKNNFWFIERMAFVQTEMGQLSAAVEYYRHLISLSPKSARYYDKTTDLLLMSNKSMEAIELLQQKEQQLGFSEGNTLKIIDICLDIKRYDIAVPEVEKLLNRPSPKLILLKKAAEVFKLSGNPEKVKQIQAKILAIDPNDVDTMLDIMERENGRIDEAGYLISLQPLVENRSISPGQKLKELLPFVEGHTKNPNVPYADALINVCAILANVHPDDARVHAMYGDVLMNSRREVEAVRQYERTLEINKTNFLVWEQLMYGLEYLGEYSRLAERADEAIEFFPNQAVSYYFRAVSLFQLGEYAKAKEYLDEATLIAAKNQIILARVYLLQSKISFKENQMSKAMELANKSIDTSPVLTGAAYEWKGDLLLLSGNKQEARSAFTKALELLPGSITLPAKIASCQ